MLSIFPMVNEFQTPPAKSPGFIKAPITAKVAHKVMLCSGMRQALQRESRLVNKPPMPKRLNHPPSTRVVSGLSFQGQMSIANCGKMNMIIAQNRAATPKDRKTHLAKGGTSKSSG